MAEVTDFNKKYLLSLKPEDLDFKTLVSIFGDDINKEKSKNGKFTIIPSRFQTTDTMTLTPSEYFVKTPTKTTVGRFIYNKYIVERIGLQDILGYVNEPLTASGGVKLEAKLSQALLDEKMTMDQFYQYIDYRDNLGMQLHSVIASSFTMNTVKTPPEVVKRKNELFKKYDKELSEGNLVIAENIEKELMSMAKEKLKGDPGLDLYNSEARGNFANYKNMNLFKGATVNAQTGGYDIIKSSFMDGIRKEDIASFGNAVIAGDYPKSIGTAESGYLSKQLLAAMQTEVLDEHGSDCHCKKTIEVELTKRNSKNFTYRYIVQNGKYICLTPELIPNYIGKTVKMRSPMYCTGEKICNICGGELNYKLNVLNIGLGCSKVSNALLKLGMKKFHISAIKSSQIDVNDMLV